MTDPGGTPFPASVASKLRSYQQQITQSIAIRDQYIQGVLDALGVAGPVRVSFETMTYASVPAEEDGRSDSPVPIRGGHLSEHR